MPNQAICVPSGDQAGAVAVPHGDTARFAASPPALPQPNPTTAIAIAEPTTAVLRPIRVMTSRGVDLDANGGPTLEGQCSVAPSGPKSFQCPSETISTVSSVTLMAVS